MRLAPEVERYVTQLQHAAHHLRAVRDVVAFRCFPSRGHPEPELALETLDRTRTVIESALAVCAHPRILSGPRAVHALTERLLEILAPLTPEKIESLVNICHYAAQRAVPTTPASLGMSGTVPPLADALNKLLPMVQRQARAQEKPAPSSTVARAPRRRSAPR